MSVMRCRRWLGGQRQAYNRAMATETSHGTLADQPAGSWRAEIRATLMLAWPIALANLASVAIHSTDVLMVSWLGAVPLAAAGIGAVLLFQVHIFCMGLVMAVSPMLAQTLGANRFSVREVRRTFRQGAWAVVAIGLLGTGLVLFVEPLLRLIGLEPQLIGPATSFILAAAPGLIPMLLFQLLRVFISALERPRAATVVTVLAIGTNALCDWVLIYGKFGFPALGLVGAGITSAVTNLLMMGALLVWVLRDRRFRRYRLLGRFWRPDWPRFREVLVLGVPISLTLTFEVSLFGVGTLLMGLIGAVESAAYQVALNIATVTFMVALGIAQAGTVRVGLSVGAGQPTAARRAGWVAVATAVTWMTAMAVLLWLAPRFFAGLYVDAAAGEGRAVFDLAVIYLGIAALFQIFDGLQVVANGVLRGYKDTRVPMILAGIGYWPVGLGTALLCAFHWQFGGIGVWYGLLTGLIATSVLLLARFVWRAGRTAATTESPALAAATIGL